MKHKQLLVALVGLIALLLVTGSVYAEGTFSGLGDRLQVGSTSRTWIDQNLDSTSTTITFEGCSHNVAIGLYRNGIEYRGGDWLYCKVKDSAMFGRQPAGSYYFKVLSIAGSKTVYVQRITVEY